LVSKLVVIIVTNHFLLLKWVVNKIFSCNKRSVTLFKNQDSK